MKKVLVFLLVLGAAAAYFYLSYHFILFDDSLKILKKIELRSHNSFVDARGAKALKLITQTDLVQAGLKDLMSKNKGLSIPLPKLN
ncbi:MAG: hypothetical protein AB1641_07690 [Thermodesulfobacteriota bacterium]